jgi:hypothetical protein
MTELPLISTLFTSPQYLLILFQPAVFTSRYLSTASNSGDSSASRAHVILSQPPVQKSLKSELLTANYQLRNSNDCLYFVMNHTENTVSTVIVLQYLDLCMRIRCSGSPGIVDVFTGRYQVKTAVHRVTAQQRVYTPQYVNGS